MALRLLKARRPAVKPRKIRIAGHIRSLLRDAL
nr:hypothetical protein [Coxiella burnetii]